MAGQRMNVALVAALLSGYAIAQQLVMYSPGGDDTSVQRIDPIISPGGISGHVHQVFGAQKLSPTLDYDDLQSSSCTTVGSADFQGNGADHSIYWHPALYMESNDDSGYVRVPTNGHKLYYLDIGTGEKASPFEYPHGFRMIAGNPFARSATGTNAVLWKCSTGGSYNVGENGAFPTGVSGCSDYPYFYGSVEFPHCWNGEDYNPSDPSAHMAYPEGDPRGGSCPSSHPKRLPHLFIESFFNIDEVAGSVKADSFVLAQGDNTGYGMHADFFNGWEDGALPDLLSTCPQPEYGNEDVGTCSNFKSSGSASSCSLPVQYKEEVDKPGKFLPGCNPVSDTNPAPIMAIAPLGDSTNTCGKGASGGGSPSPSSDSPPTSSYAPSPTNTAPAETNSAPAGAIATSSAATSYGSQPVAESSGTTTSSASAPSATYTTGSTAVYTTLMTSTIAYSPSAATSPQPTWTWTGGW